MLPTGYTEQGRALHVRMAGRGGFDEVLPVLIRGNSWSQLPTEHLGDALLSIHRDWFGLPAQRVAMLMFRLELLNAEIIEQQRQMIEGPAPRTVGPAPRPTRKANPKRRPRAGRR